MLSQFEGSGRTVRRVTIDGRRIEFELEVDRNSDEFDQIDMRHDKT